MRAIAYDQLTQLIGLGSPTMRLITPDKNTAKLEKRGFVVGLGGAFCITSAGLRQLADEMDRGNVARAIDKMKAENDERRRRRQLREDMRERPNA